MSSYTYSVATNFAGLPPSLKILTAEIQNTITSPVLTDIGFLGDSLVIQFDSALSPAQVSSLDSLCTPGIFGGENTASDNFSFANSSNLNSFTTYKGGSYREILQVKYPGSNFYGTNPTQLTVIAAGNSSTGSFRVQIKDLDNKNKIVATLTVNGTLTSSPQEFTTSVFSNVSTKPVRWSINILASPPGADNSSTDLYSIYLRYV